jgi:hypothetical protein
MKRVNTSFSVIVTSHEESRHFLKKCPLSSWLVTITLKEVFTLFMAGYNYTKRSVHSLHDWLPTMKRVNTSFSVIVTSHEESEHFF